MIRDDTEFTELGERVNKEMRRLRTAKSFFQFVTKMYSEHPDAPIYMSCKKSKKTGKRRLVPSEPMPKSFRFRRDIFGEFEYGEALEGAMADLVRKCTDSGSIVECNGYTFIPFTSAYVWGFRLVTKIKKF